MDMTNIHGGFARQVAPKRDEQQAQEYVAAHA
jgi:hypothetical protein